MPQDANADLDFSTNCPGVSTLVAWIKQRMDKKESSAIEQHVESCDICQNNLNRLTEDPNLPRPDGNQPLARPPKYDADPHFQRLRKNVLQQLSDLSDQRSKTNPDSNQGEHPPEATLI